MTYTHRHPDYVYRTPDDDMRFRIFARHPPGGPKMWDYDVYYRHKPDANYTTGTEIGEYFRRKKDAKADIVQTNGPIVSINPEETVTDGWD